MGAVLGQQARAPGRVAERHQVLAEQPDPDRIAVRSGYLLRQQGRKPVPAEQVTDQRAAAGLGQGAVFGGAEGGY